jgi:DNA invertase Pin-like site-specific DNA recombinase
MRAFAYLRVSTDRQFEGGAGIAAQHAACQQWADRQGIPISEIFIEEGISGSTGLDKRPALLQAISSLCKGDVLLVARRDRLGRDPFGVAMIEAGVTRKKAKIVSAAGEGTDSDDPSSILMRRMIDAFSEFERNIIRGRTKSAMAAKKLKGERVGHIPFGFQLAEGNRIEPNQTEQAILAQIRELRLSGMSIREIAKELNDRGTFNRNGNRWNHESIRNAMTKIAA